MSLSELSDASLVERWQRRGDDAAREALVHRYRGLVRALAARYVNWGEPFDDLVQVAWIGLLKAIERYDSERGVQFPTYATPTIVGEIRRYYRDRAWAVHVPRSVQELRVRVNADDRPVERRARRGPDDRAARGVPRRLARTRCSTRSTARTPARRWRCRAARTTAASSGFDVPTEERGFDQVDASLLLAGGLDDLAERERQIVAMRFEEGLTQSQIAARIGISQMHVSRLLRRALSQLRASVGDVGDAPTATERLLELADDAQDQELGVSPARTTSTCLATPANRSPPPGRPPARRTRAAPPGANGPKLRSSPPSVGVATRRDGRRRRCRPRRR